MDKKKTLGTGIVLTELRKMLPTYLILNGILLLACGAYLIISESNDWRVFTGVLAGNIASTLNFLVLGLSADKSLSRKAEKKAQFTANMWYGLRFIGLFAFCVILLLFKAVNLITLVIPLFFPRIHYIFEYSRKKFD